MDFKHNTPFSIAAIEDRIRSCTPDGMMDLMILDATVWNAFTMHDNHFEPNDESEAENPNEFVKWAVEMAIPPEFDIKSIEKGNKFFSQK